MDRYPWCEIMLFMFFIYLLDLYSCNKRLSLRDIVVIIINPARDLHNLFLRTFLLTSSLKHKVDKLWINVEGGNPELTIHRHWQYQTHKAQAEDKQNTKSQHNA